MKIGKKPNYSTVFIVGILFLCFLLYSIHFVVGLKNQNETDVSYYLQDATHQRKQALARQIEFDFSTLEKIGAGIATLPRQTEDVLLTTLRAVNGDEGFLRIGVFDTDGKGAMIDPDGQVYRNASLADTPYFEEVLRGNNRVSDVFYDDISGEYVAYSMVPMVEYGTVSRVLCGVRSDTVLRDILSTPITAEYGLFFVVDGRGVVQVPGPEPSATIRLGTNLLDLAEFPQAERDALARALDEGRDGQYAFTFAGSEYIAAADSLDINGWLLVSVLDRQAIDTYYARLLSGISIILLLGSATILFLVYSQTREARRVQETLESLAYRDTLTGGPNFIKFQLDAQALLDAKPKQPFAVWTFDTKNFTLINDIFGSEKGDAVLRRIYTVLATDAPPDSLTCRMGSDVFVGIRPYADREELRAFFWSCIGMLANREVIRENQLRIDDAMGVYCTGDFAEDSPLSDMVNRASAARRKAKEQPGNAIEFFTPALQDEQKWTATLEAAAPKALENGEFTFFLQPKVTAQDGYRIIGAEALARWNYPGVGILPPACFIPIFEKNGFIVDLDRYIFEQVCLWHTFCREKGVPCLRWSVNVSRHGLLREDIIPYYAGIKEKYAIEDGALELEFTESLILDDHELFTRVLTGLKEKGFVCAIDDFGAGYSSLNLLRNLPADVLKLDAEFFRGDGDTGRDRIVVENFIHMAKELGVSTVAEGVEVACQVHFLEETGCDLIQGYVFSKPLPKETFETMLLSTGGTYSLIEED